MFVTSFILFIISYFWFRHLQSRSFPSIIALTLFTRFKYRITVLCTCSLLVSINIYGFVYNHAIFYQDYMGLSTWEHVIKVLPTWPAGVVAAVSIVPALLCIQLM